PEFQAASRPPPFQNHFQKRLYPLLAKSWLPLCLFPDWPVSISSTSNFRARTLPAVRHNPWSGFPVACPNARGTVWSLVRRKCSLQGAGCLKQEKISSSAFICVHLQLKLFVP